MSSTTYRRNRRAAGLCPDCGCAGGWCRPCRDRANARHRAWREANRDHFRAAQARQRMTRRARSRLRASIRYTAVLP